MSKITILLFGLFLLISCKEEIKPLPIEEKKLSKILIDVHVAEAAMQPLVGPKKDSLRQLYYEQIFEIHQVSQSSFEESMDLITQNPRRLRFFYEDMINDVEKIKSKKAIKTKSRSFSKSNQDSLSQE